MNKKIRGLGDLSEEEFEKYLKFREQKEKEDLAKKKAIGSAISAIGSVIWHLFWLILLIVIVVWIIYSINK